MKPLVNSQGSMNFPQLDIALGNVGRVSKPIDTFGRNQDIDTGSVPEDVWNVGGLWVPPTQARVHEVVSDNVNDTVAGSGARTIMLEGLDANWDAITEIIAMNGTTPVITQNSFVRINSATILTAGLSLENAGQIDITAQVDSTISARINPTAGKSEMAIRTIPAGKIGILSERPWISMNKQGGTSGAMIDICFRSRPYADNPEMPWRNLGSVALSVEGTSIAYLPFSIYETVPEKTDLALRCTSVTDNNMDVSGGFQILLVDM